MSCAARRPSFSPSVRCGPSTSSSFGDTAGMLTAWLDRAFEEKIRHLLRDIDGDLHLRLFGRGRRRDAA